METPRKIVLISTEKMNKQTNTMGNEGQDSATFRLYKKKKEHQHQN